MDACFREHDRAYQGGADRDLADLALARRLRRLRVAGGYARLYRVLAMAAFTFWPILRRVLKCAGLG
jgi:hypothetical protein